MRRNWRGGPRTSGSGRSRFMGAPGSSARPARAALEQSGADALMLGRGVYGRPWLAAHLERALADGTVMEEPGREDRLAIVIDHLRASVAFYGMPLGLKMFRKHLGWYVEQAP